MRLKNFSDFGNKTDEEKVDEIVNDDVVNNIPTENVETEHNSNVKKVEEKSDTINTNLNKRTIPFVPKEERSQMAEGYEPKNKDSKLKDSTVKSTNEEVLLKPSDKDLPVIEILEENVIKFNSGHINEILETIKTKYSDTDYFLRKKDNQLHIVKYNEQRTLNVNNFVNSLLKFYSTNKENNNIIKNIKVKGNHSFSIVENMNPRFINKFVNDISKLLANKKD